MTSYVTRTGWTGEGPGRYPLLDPSEERRQPITPMHDEDDRPRKSPTHEIGQKLDAISVDELDARIALLRAEIERLEEAKAAKQSALSAASTFFKPR